MVKAQMALPPDPPPVTFLGGLEPDQNIYRIFSQSRFEEMLFHKKLALVRPALWDDPYENFIHQLSVVVDGRTVGLDPIRQSYWSLNPESDAMWRIYAPPPEKKGIRVTTTVQKLANVLHNRTKQMGMPQHSPHKCFVGKVSYLDFSEMMPLMLNSNARMEIISDTTGRMQATTLLIKRPAFAHEQEVRAIYNNVGEPDKDTFPDVIPFDIDPDEFIEQICFDPRMLNVFNEEKKKLQDRGIKIPIVISLLYEPLENAVLKKFSGYAIFSHLKYYQSLNIYSLT